MFDISAQSQIGHLIRYSLFYVFLSFLFILDLISFSIPLTDEVRPFFTIIILYYWIIYRPAVLHPILVFSLGIIFDLVMWFPMGVHSIIFLLIQYIINSQRLYFLGQTYLVLWIGFILTAMSVYLIEWLFFSLLALQILTLKPIAASFMLTAMLFPLIAVILKSLGKILPADNMHLFEK